MPRPFCWCSHTDHILQSQTLPKKFGDFQEFYPFYLMEHSQIGTKQFHLVGTAFLAVLLAITPDLLFALLAAGATGYAAYPYFRTLPTGVPEFALMVGTYLVMGMRLTGSWRRTLAIPVCSYAFAWLGHALVEHNRPATFVYPIFSLMGDLNMAADMVTGKISGWY